MNEPSHYEEPIGTMAEIILQSFVTITVAQLRFYVRLKSMFCNQPQSETAGNVFTQIEESFTTVSKFRHCQQLTSRSGCKYDLVMIRP